MVAHRVIARALPLIAGLIAIAPLNVRAAGVNLSWDDCGAAGTVNKTFACNTNSGAAVLVGSFVAPSGINALLGVTASLDIWSSPDSVGTPIPDWWQFGTGGCRAGRLSVGFDFTGGPYSCTDPWSGHATGGKDYAAGVPLTNHATLRLIGAVPEADSLALTADTEYYTFKVVISFQNTTGTGNCSGCSSPISIALSSVTLSQPAPTEDVVLTQAATSNVVTWQGGAGLGPNLPRQRVVTYGQIRNLYH
jgi:hypothetical protein